MNDKRQPIGTHEIDLSGTAHGQLAIARRILTMDELVEMTGAVPQFEKEIKLPGDSRGATNTVFLFSVNGMLKGQAVKGALLAGECMMVQARTLKMAERICKEGLRDTIGFAHEEFDNRSVIELPESAANEGVSVDAGGRSARPGDDPELLKSDPTLKTMLSHLIGKLPWKH